MLSLGFTDIEYDLFKAYGQNTISCLAGTLEKERFRPKDVAGFVSYCRYRDFVLVLGEPVCSPEHIRKLVLDFHGFCHRNKWREIYFSALGDSEDYFPSDKFSKIHLGDEAIVMLPMYHCGKKVKRMIHRAEKHGVTVRELTEKQMKSAWFRATSGRITRYWLEGKRNELIMFIVNNNFSDCQKHQRIFLAKKRGAVIGFMTAYAVPASNSLYVDITRINKFAPNGTSELMVNHLLSAASSEKISFVSLGMVPLSSIEKPEQNSLLLRCLFSLLYNYGGWLYPSKSEFYFKNKFLPVWRPVYVFCSQCTNILDLYNMFRIFQPLTLREYLLRYLTRLF